MTVVRVGKSGLPKANVLVNEVGFWVRNVMYLEVAVGRLQLASDLGGADFYSSLCCRICTTE